MDLSNEFTVPVSVDRAWEVLNDVELIAPCLPGAQLQEVEGDEYRGIVKVKVGPITAQYKGAAVFQEQDVENRRIVLKAEGRDTRGQGSASAIITATMTEVESEFGSSTHVVVDSDVTIKGKVAQFGRGMIAEVSAKLLTQFVECLEGKLDAEPAEVPGADASQGGGPVPVETTGDPAAEAAKQQAEAPSAAPSEATSSTSSTTRTTSTPTAEATNVRRIDHAESAPVDLLDSAGIPMAKRAVPVAVAFVLLLLIGRRRSTKRKRS